MDAETAGIDDGAIMGADCPRRPGSGRVSWRNVRPMGTADGADQPIARRPGRLRTGCVNDRRGKLRRSSFAAHAQDRPASWRYAS